MLKVTVILDFACSLAKFSPNHHKLAEEYVLLDNLYCNGQVSRDGHPWSTAAYHTDYTARDWHLTYSGRRGVPDTDDDDLQTPPSGYLWDAAKRANLSYRNYGEKGRRVSEPERQHQSRRWRAGFSGTY